MTVLLSKIFSVANPLMPMDAATQMNQWIALVAELEDTKEQVAKGIYKQYKAGKLIDEVLLDGCRRIDDLHKDAKQYEQHLQDDFKSLVVGDEKKKAGAVDKAKVKAVNFFSSWYIKANVANFKRHFKDQWMELGQRTITLVEESRPVTDDGRILNLCRYAVKLKKDADHRWEEIQILQRENAHGFMFLSTLQNFVVQLAFFSHMRAAPFLKKYLKYDENLQKKVREEYRKAWAARFSGGEEKKEGSSS